MFELGQQVVVKAKMVPNKQHDYLGSITRRIWRRVELPKSRLGIFAGFRTVREGKTDRDPDYGYYFEPTKYIKVALIAVSLKSTILVLPDDICQLYEEE